MNPQEMQFIWIVPRCPWKRKRSEGFILCWGVKYVGFGTITFNREPGRQWECDDQYMGRDFVRVALEKFITRHPFPRKAGNRRWVKRRAQSADPWRLSREFLLSLDAVAFASEVRGTGLWKTLAEEADEQEGAE